MNRNTMPEQQRHGVFCVILSVYLSIPFLPEFFRHHPGVTLGRGSLGGGRGFGLGSGCLGCGSGAAGDMAARTAAAWRIAGFLGRFWTLGFIPAAVLEFGARDTGLLVRPAAGGRFISRRLLLAVVGRKRGVRVIVRHVHLGSMQGAHDLGIRLVLLAAL